MVSISGFAVARTKTPMEIANRRSKVIWTRFVKISAWAVCGEGPLRYRVSRMFDTIAAINRTREKRKVRFWKDFRVGCRPTAERIKIEMNKAVIAPSDSKNGGSAMPEAPEPVGPAV